MRACVREREREKSGCVCNWKKGGEMKEEEGDEKTGMPN